MHRLVSNIQAEAKEHNVEKNVSEEEILQKLFAAIVLGSPFRLTELQRNCINYVCFLFEFVLLE
jgi:hypothetical protein